MCVAAAWDQRTEAAGEQSRLCPKRRNGEDILGSVDEQGQQGGQAGCKTARISGSGAQSGDSAGGDSDICLMGAWSLLRWLRNQWRGRLWF